MLTWGDIVDWWSGPLYEVATYWRGQFDADQRLASELCELIERLESEGLTVEAARQQLGHILKELRKQASFADGMEWAYHSCGKNVDSVMVLVADAYEVASKQWCDIDSSGKVCPSEILPPWSGLSRVVFDLLRVMVVGRAMTLAVTQANQADRLFAAALNRLGLDAVPLDDAIDAMAGPLTPDDIRAALISAGLLQPGDSTVMFDLWLERLAANGVSLDEILKIVAMQGITPHSFDVLDGMEPTVDPDGKLFFLLPPGTSPEVAQQAVLMTYILNAGTGYQGADHSPQDTSGTMNDFPATPFSNAEIDRIRQRMAANAWSYKLLAVCKSSGGQFMTTPNGMIMGLSTDADHGGPNELLGVQGGTTFGDVFFVNIDNAADPAATLQTIVTKGIAPATYDSTGQTGTGIDLDRLLHHEEMHSQQWGSLGFKRYAEAYAGAAAVSYVGGKPNIFETLAGLADGGYS